MPTCEKIGPDFFENAPVRFIWERGKHMAFYFTETSRSVWSAFAEDYQVTDLGGGRCKLLWRLGYAPRGFFRLIHPLVRGLMKKHMKKIFDTIGPYVDAQKG